MTHPDDDTGDALRRLEAEGDDLSRARDIDFTIVFPESSKAEQFAAHFRKMGYRATLCHAAAKEKHPWDVVVVKHMIPSHSRISGFEQSSKRLPSR